MYNQIKRVAGVSMVGLDQDKVKMDEVPLDSFSKRIAELRLLLGLSGRQFVEQLGMSSGVATQWEKGIAVANRDQAARISKRYGVSMDSLYGLNTIDKLEPSPPLLEAQAKLRDAILSGLVTAPSPAERLAVVREVLISSDAITEAGWSDWLQLSGTGWDAITVGNRIPLDPQLRGAAMLCGWYGALPVWEEWLRTGDSDELQSYDQAELTRILETIALHGVSAYKLRQLLRDITK